MMHWVAYTSTERFESVSVTTTPAFAFGNPVPVTKRFTNSPPTAKRGYDMTPSGDFLGLIPAGQTEAVVTVPSILFVLNWHEELKRLAPTK